jgi:heme/copper-type cytochrome/quinol oxidase subunit 2
VRAAAQALRVEAPQQLPPAAVLLAAGGVVAAAAAAGAVAGGVHSHVGSAPAADRLSLAVSYVATAGLLTLLVAAFTLFVILRPRAVRKRADAAEGPPLRKRDRAAIIVGCFLVLVAPLVVLLLLSHSKRTEVLTTPGRPGAGRRGKPFVSTHVHIQWTFFFSLVVAGLVVLVWAAVIYRRRRAEALEELPEDLLAPVVAAGAEALERERDPRRAVIRAYLVMESTLGDRGIARRPSETPVEYLGRVLVELGAAASPARRLTSLFERARFSQHEIDERMRADAQAALAAVREPEAEG